MGAIIYKEKLTNFKEMARPIGGKRVGPVRPEKFQFLEKGQNRNFGYKILISVKNLKFIL